MFGEVFWLGGGSGGGKSTVARRLGLPVYDTDAVMGDHARRAGAADAPMLDAFLRMDHDERWLTRSPRVMLETFHWFRGEAFDLIVDDLRARPPGPVVAEGFRLLPRLVAPLLPGPGHAVWLLPTAQFRRRAFDSRGSTWLIAGQTSDPPRALANLLERDAAFTQRVRAEATALGLPVIDVDVTMTTADLTGRVRAALTALPATTP
jgi:hypothetical protein